MKLTTEQEKILNSTKKNVVVSASAGSGKTFVLVEKLISLIRDGKVPVSRLLVLTFTKAAAKEMKSRLQTAMLQQKPDEFLLQQIDDISISDISTIDSFCEKIIKRNISKLDIDEGFAILDERGIASLKERAFQSAYDKFSCQQEDFDNVYFAFKKSKERIAQCLTEMQSYFEAQAESNVCDRFLNEIENFTKEAYKFLKGEITKKINSALYFLSHAKTFADIPEKAMEVADGFYSMLARENFDEMEFFNLCKTLSNICPPDLPRAKCDEGFKKSLAKAKELVKECKTMAENYPSVTTDDVAELEKATLAKALLKLFKLYQEKYSALKASRGVLDFADIERYAQTLLKDEEIKKDLQAKYDYIFIDEYQDTNTLQESILKPIAQGGYFTGVGDIKQGIYGFRNASKEIMLRDISDFSRAEDAEALYLNGNFRTDDKVLSFVNDVFDKIMTKQSVGIDYKENSRLTGLKEFKEDQLPAVSVDVVCDEEKQEKIIRSGVYSVKEDNISCDEKYKKELLTIEARIDEVLGQQIYDAKAGEYRKVNQSDIAILFRSRGNLMQACATHLEARGYSVEADIKNSLLEDGQIRVIAALLKLTINMKDDISLAAVMSSVFGEFSLGQLAALRQNEPEKEFYNIVLESREEKVVAFVEKIEKFRFEVQTFGIIKALQRLFGRCDYASYLKSLVDANEKNAHINELFKLIRSCDFDFKPMSVISLLQQNSKQKSTAEGSSDAITITTIHATKGLEYPIVFLCGAGESLSKVYNKNYVLSPSFGLGTQVYNFDNDSLIPSPTFLAGKIKKLKEEYESELMIFYVALTRAQNHLYIIGSGKEKNFTFEEVEKQSSYLKLIMFALGENFVSQLFEQGQILTAGRRFSIISNVLEKGTEKNKKEINCNNLNKFSEKIDKYYDFIYKNQKNCKLNYKNSVTGVLNLENEEKFEKEFNLNKEEGQRIKNSVDYGNAYHEALKLIEFNKINSLDSLTEELNNKKRFFTEGYFELIDLNILYKNITIIKELIKDQKVFKEQEFLMKCSLKELGMADVEEEFVIVQGIVDFFAIGKENILIDFKFTSIKDEEKLKKRYEKQIILYRKAIEKAFGKKINKQYLLSLKEAKLIKI